nr:putative protein far1-related sequence 10 [Quercus suber]
MYHPDVNKQPGAMEKFKEISAAYEFSNVHNHELLEDDQVRLLPAYRKIHEAGQERILLLSKAGFPIHRIVKVLELEKGIQGGHLPFLERDYWEELMGSILYCRVACGINLVALAELVLSVFCASEESTEYIYSTIIKLQMALRSLQNRI